MIVWKHGPQHSLDLAANLGYSDMADASQRMSFVRDGYAYDRKTSYENDAALLSQRFGSGACA